jgi:predicted O-linked N-acetylglucosamine transferase (SPINDLY family)
MQLLNQIIAKDALAPEPYFLIGLIFQQQRQLPQAISAYRTCLSLRPDDPRALNNLGRALVDAGQIDQGKLILQQAVAAAPSNAGALSNLGDAYRMRGDATLAMVHYKKAISVDPNCMEAHCNLGIALAQANHVEQSIACFERAIAINPGAFNARFNLTRVLQDASRFDEALVQCRLAIQTRPTNPEAHNVMGNLHGIMGDVPTCIAEQRLAVQLQPTHAANDSNLLLSLQYRDDLSIEQRFTAHKRWNQQHIAPLSPITRQPRISEGRIRIGYVSPNFQTHSVAYFIEPVLAAHDRSAFEVFLYSNTKNPDSATPRFQKHADHWREIARMPDAAAAKLIADDRIDILIDLAGHTSGNRLPVFGLRPAPVQITWIGYPDTTGMSAIDYRLTDAVADPPGDADRYHTEKLLRLEGGCWVYAPPPNAPLPSLPPVVANGFITFGSFNNLPKVTPQVLQAWASILHAVPHSRLVMKAAGLQGQMGRDLVLGQLSNAGITPDRVDLISWAPTTSAHLDLYSRIDIALDTFPYNGTTTTCEALWMGVPVITFPGLRHAARVGASLLTHAGLTDWLASDLESYIKLAAKVAADKNHLIQTRSDLRLKLQRSPLFDATRITRQLEVLFKQSIQPPSAPDLTATS